MDLTVVIPVYNIWRRPLPGHDESESMKRVYYSLLSIAGAKRIPNVIIPDGSTPRNFERLAEYTKQFPNVRHIHLEQGSTMNLSKLWNQGMILAETDYLLATGIDFLYAPSYFTTLAERADPKKMLISQVLMCAPKWTPTDQKVNEWMMPEYADNNDKQEENICYPNPAGDHANGVQLFHKSWFADGGGYDEQIIMWGAMDNQMVKRAKVYGLEVEWIKEKEVYHIWHPADKFKSHKSNAQFNKNQIRLNKTTGFRVEN